MKEKKRKSYTTAPIRAVLGGAGPNWEQFRLAQCSQSAKTKVGKIGPSAKLGVISPIGLRLALVPISS